MKSAAADRPRELAGAGDRPFWSSPLIQALALVALVLVAFAPGLTGVFTWDDYECIVENPMLQTPAGLLTTWTDPISNQDFYPLVFTTYWIEHRLWGVDPLGYHVVNALLHAGGAIVLFGVVRRLGVRGAWVIAALWAVHPVQVESVTWAVERKNVLSGVLFLGAVLAYLRFAGIGERGVRHWRWWGVAIVCFVGALLSKPLTCTLPAVLVILLFWKLERVPWRDVWPALVFFLPAAAMAVLGMWVQTHHVGTAGPDFVFSPAERVLIAGRSIWFYVWKLLVPYPLMQVYPRFAIDARAAWQYVLPVALAGTLVVLWLFRQRLSRGPLAAALCFVVILSPALGFISYYTMLYTFVADHHQYLAAACMIALLVAVTARALARVPVAARVGAAALALAGCTSLTWFYAGLYRSEVGLWDFNLRHNPRSFIVHVNMGDALLKEYNRTAESDPALAGDILRAVVAHFNVAIRLKPTDERAYARLILMAQDRLDPEAFRANFTRMEANVPPGVLKMRGAGGDLEFFLAKIYEKRREFALAEGHYRKSLAESPRNVQAILGLAGVAAAQGRREEAADWLRQAEQIDPGITNRLSLPRTP